MQRFIVVAALALPGALTGAPVASAQQQGPVNCEAEAKRPVKLVRLLGFKGVSTCTRKIDLLHVQVCAEEQRRSGHYSTRRCKRFTCGNCRSISGRVWLTCRRRHVYRTKAQISGADQDWFFGDFLWVYSGERRC